MVAELVKRGDKYICSECRMQQRGLQWSCWFCGKTFSNYENILLKKLKEEADNESHVSRESTD